MLSFIYLFEVGPVSRIPSRNSLTSSVCRREVEESSELKDKNKDREQDTNNNSSNTGNNSADTGTNDDDVQTLLLYNSKGNYNKPFKPRTGTTLNKQT